MWSTRPRSGWIVGSGADEEDEIRSRYAIDPGRRWQQLADEREHDPVMGWIHTAMSPFEVPTTAFQWAAGTAQGLAQRGMELGASAWGTLNGQTIPVGLPPELRRMEHPLGDEPTRLDPEVRNPVDPAEALARYHALTPEPAQLGLEIMGTWGLSGLTRLPGKLAQGNTMLQRFLRPGQGEWGVLENTPLLQPPVGGPSAWDQIRAAAVSPIAQDVAKVAPPVGGAVAAGLTGPTDQSPTDRAGRALEGALGGLVVGGLTSSAQNYIQRTARIYGKFEPHIDVPAGMALDPLTQDLLKRQTVAPYWDDRPVPRQGHPNMTNYDPNALVPARYPGGRFNSASANLAWAETRAASTDRNAVMDDLTNGVKILAEDMGVPFTEDLNLVDQLKTLHGSVARAEQWLAGDMPASARAAAVAVMGPKAVLYTHGIQNEAQLRHLEDMWAVKTAMDRAAQPEPLATGHLGKDLGTQGLHYQKLQDLADHNWGTGMGAHMDQAINELTDFSNAVLDYYAEKGMLSLAARDEAKRTHLTYGYLQAVDDQFDAIWRKPERPTEPLTPTSEKVKQYFSEDDPTKQIGIDTTASMARYVKMIQLADMNDFAVKIHRAAEQFPDTLGTWWRPIDQATSHVEKGWRQVAYFIDGNEYRALTPEPLANLLRGVNVEAADQITGAMAKMSNLFRKSVTVWNPPFIMANVPRDMYHAMVNTDMPLDVLWHYMGGMTSVVTRDLDDWFRYHQQIPVVGKLPETIWTAFRDHVLKPAFNADPDQVRQAIDQGMGMTTLTSVIRGRETPKELLGVKPTIDSPLAKLGTKIESATDMLEAVSDVTELSTRMAVYRAALSRGATPFSAAIAGREATVDFSKAGNITRLANLWLPLLNARVQGELRTFRAARDDPFGFAMREMALSGVPTLMTYAWNRTLFGDLYEMIPLDERMRNHVLVYGSMTDDNDRVKPMYLRIPKDQVASAFTTPLEHVLDAMYHTRHHGQPLEGEQRTDAPSSWVAMRALGSLLPTDMYPTEMTSPLAWITSALSMNPIFNAAQGIVGNQDPYRRQPIVPDEQMALPPEYRYGPQTPTGYKALSHVLTRLFDRMGVETNGMNWLAPSVMQFAARGMGGALPDYLLQQLDVAMPKLQEIGLVPPGAFVPATPEDLRLPPGTPIEIQNRYLSTLEQPDNRPLYARLFPRFFGSSARAGSMQERAAHLGEREQEQARQTQAFNRAYQAYLVDWRADLNKLDEAPDKSHQSKLDEVQRLGRARQGAYNALRQDYPLAITDQKELREFQSRLPGIGSEWMMQELPQLPAGWNGEKIAEYLKNPPNVNMATLNVSQRYQAQRRALNSLSQQLGQPVNVLEMYAGMSKLGAEVPGVAVPNLAIEEAITRYMNPVDAHGEPLDATTTPAHLMRRAREAVQEDIARTWGVSPDLVKATMDARLNNPMELSADGVSRMRATMLWQRLHDPDRFPEYVNPDGSALGNEAQWAQWDADLAKARQQYNNRLPPQYARLEAAKKFAEMRQLQALAKADPDLLGPLPAVAIADHDRWYGTGRAMTSRQWAMYNSGLLPRYTSGGPQEWAQWDMMQKMYAATPPGIMKDRMRNQIRQIRKMQTPGWRDIIQRDQLLREDALYDEMETV